MAKRRCGIYFTFTHLCGLFVPKPLVGFLFQFYFLIGQRFVFPSFKFGFESLCTVVSSSYSCTFFYCSIYFSVSDQINK